MKRGDVSSLWIWATALVVTAALAAAWGARQPPVLANGNSIQTNLPDRRVEQIEAVLAQAGCPGWMVLASEGKTALKPPAEPAAAVVPPHVHETALRLATHPPRVRYPVPVRVAMAPRAARRPTLATGSRDDPDDLLDGVPDLLHQPESDSDGVADGAAEDEPEEEPNQQQDTTPVADISEPAAEPVAETESLPAEEPVAESAADELLLLPPSEPAVTKPAAIPTVEEQLGPPATVEPIPTPPIFSLPPVAPAPHSVTQPVTQPAAPADRRPAADRYPNDDPHHDLFAETLYPSAQSCRKCHEKLYDEWSVSSHAYAMVSPMFHKFEQKVNDLTNGTMGYFCYRCHSPVGVTLGISRAAPLWQLPKIAREGITCVACHRVSHRYGKVNGERRIDPGDVFQPVYGTIGGSGVAETIARKNHFKVKTFPHETGPGQDIHSQGVYFDQLGKSDFCASCHQVAVHPGIKLEVVWEQYRASPACKKGISCQDCHMGRLPGVPSGYEVGPAAVVNDKVVHPHRKHSNHTFYGPGYSIAHPGIFPHNPQADRWSMLDWLQFDYRSDWGTNQFEDRVANGQIRVTFPPAWAEVDDRFDAREIINDNIKKLAIKKHIRKQLMENGSHVDGPFFEARPQRGQNLKFHYVVINTNEGHNLPSGSLGAQPQLWANVVLIGPRGQRIWESGYTDRWGDVADIHSEDVQNKRLPYDWQLFNLQSKFLITGATGTDREFFLPVNLDIDQLAFIRPGAQPISVINHPPYIRMEGRSIPALGSRRAPYRIPKQLLCEPGHYRLSFRLRSRIEPVYFMRFCGSTPEMIQAMNEGILDFHEMSVEFEVR